MRVDLSEDGLVGSSEIDKVVIVMGVDLLD